MLFFLILKTLLENELHYVDLVRLKTSLSKVQLGFYGQISIWYHDHPLYLFKCFKCRLQPCLVDKPFLLTGNAHLAPLIKEGA